MRASACVYACVWSLTCASPEVSTRSAIQITDNYISLFFVFVLRLFVTRTKMCVIWAWWTRRCISSSFFFWLKNMHNKVLFNVLLYLFFCSNFTECVLLSFQPSALFPVAVCWELSFVTDDLGRLSLCHVRYGICGGFVVRSARAWLRNYYSTSLL